MIVNDSSILNDKPIIVIIDFIKPNFALDIGNSPKSSGLDHSQIGFLMRLAHVGDQLVGQIAFGNDIAVWRAESAQQ